MGQVTSVDERRSRATVASSGRAVAPPAAWGAGGPMARSRSRSAESGRRGGGVQDKVFDAAASCWEEIIG